ncbi:MAG: glycosyltransferase family 4 protein [Chloroflexi bacterium]|nr:glycosyltransferase family 4 protein [Chloroflexota bacterium]
MARALSRRGHNVHVVTVGLSHHGVMMEGDITVHRIPATNGRLRSISYLLHSYRVSREIAGCQTRFDVVQASEWSGEAYCYSFRPRFPLISRLATPSFLVRRLNRSDRRPASRVVNHMERTQVCNSTGIISSTGALAKVVCAEWHIPPAFVQIVPNCVDTAWIGSFEEVPPKADVWSLDYLLFYGRLEERKGVQVLAEALPGILRNYPDLGVVFVGADGAYQGHPMREHVRKRCSSYADRLTFLDALPQPQLFPIVARARLVVLPSIWEAFGFVCLEAMCVGRAVVASAGSGFEEIIEDGHSGYLVEPGNARDLEAMLAWCLAHPEEVMRVGRKGRDRAKSFDADNIALSLVQCYERLLRPKSESSVQGWEERRKAL